MRPPGPDILRRAALFARTTRHLRPAQIAHRARLRAQKQILARFPDTLAARLRRPLPPEPKWPHGFEPLDLRLAGKGDAASANGMAGGRFTFLGHERRIGYPPDWDQAGADQLWRYHLHYFEWAWVFAALADRSWARRTFGALWRSWHDGTTFGRWDAWSPYVVSLRAWALCGLYAPLMQGTEHEDAYLDDLALHAGFVRANLEHDVGGNHLVKNLKAMAGLGVFLADGALTDLAVRHLTGQVGVQVLGDGGHFERSPAYHCQVLGDLIDVAGILEAADRPVPAALDTAIADMRIWLGAMLMPDGDVPLFNDCTRVGPDRLALLGPGPPPPADRRLTVLLPSGYVVVRTGGGRLHLVADVGPPCPPDLPAHAHADCLSFELAVDGKRLIVDTGTSTYRPGTRRQYERSTAAHNTVEVDGVDQTEVWGTFRAARRAAPRLERTRDDDKQGEETVEVTASHDGYERLPGRPRHRRTWRVGDETIEIIDDIRGTGTHHSVARLLLAAGTEVEIDGTGRFRMGGVEIIHIGGEARLEPAEVAEAFGRTTPTCRVRCETTGPLPHQLVTRISTTTSG